MGGTWFFMSDGSKKYLAGYFCCGLHLPEEQFASLSELKDFIKKHDGTRP